MVTEILLGLSIVALVVVVLLQQRQIQRIVMLALEDHRRRSERPAAQTTTPSFSSTGAVRLMPDNDGDASMSNRLMRE